MPAPDDPDFYEDIFVAAGTDLSWGFRIQPLDLTGATAVFRCSILDEDGDIDIVVDTTSPFPTSELTFTVEHATTSVWDPGFYDYRVFVTFADDTILEYGHGKLVVS